MRAYHWRSALDLARASGTDNPDLVDRARFSLRDAGDRASGLNNHATAASLYDDALGLWPDGDSERPELLFRLAVALHEAYDESRQERALEAARDALLAAGDTERASETEAYLARVFWDRGDHDLVSEHLARAEDLAGESTSVAAARVLAFSARIRNIAGETEEAQPLAEAAFAMATELGLEELRAHALTTIGMTKNDLDFGTGTADMERALEIALAADSPVAATTVNNLAVQATFAAEFPRTEELYDEATAPCRAIRRRVLHPVHPRQPRVDRPHARTLGRGTGIGERDSSRSVRQDHRTRWSRSSGRCVPRC